MRNVVPLIPNNSRQKELMKIGSRSEMILWGKPWSLHTVSRNKLATLNVVKCVGNAPRWTPLENLSTTTKTTVNPWELGRCVTKSMERSSQTPLGIRIGWSKLANLRVTCLNCWHMLHWWMNDLTSVAIVFHWKFERRRCKVFLTPKWPPRGAAWYSCNNVGMNGFRKSIQTAPLKNMRLLVSLKLGWSSGRDWMASRYF